MQVSKNLKYPLLFSNKDSCGYNSQIVSMALEDARRIAALLRDEYGAGNIIIFGSLTDKNQFNENSDIDLAVQGIPDERFFSAVSAATNISERFSVDIVDLDDCKESLRKTIERDGIPI